MERKEKILNFEGRDRKGRKKALFVGFLFFFLLAGSLSIVLSKETKSLITGEKSENLLKASEKEEVFGRSPFSGVSCAQFESRAFGIILHQSPETMPLSSPSEADIVIEAPVANAGGITRLLAIFQCQSPKEIGSIRSARPYTADLALGFDIILSSWGGSDSAISRIKELGVDFFDARVNPVGIFFRKTNIPAPHNGFTSSEGLKKAAQSLGMRGVNQFEGYKFLDDNDVIYQKKEQVIDIDYYYYPVRYVYDLESGNYLRFWNGKEMMDRNNGEQVFAKNVILMDAKIEVLSEGVVKIELIGEGEAKIYQAGSEIEGKWEKEDSKGKLTFFDPNGDEVKFIPGPIWIEIVN